MTVIWPTWNKTCNLKGISYTVSSGNGGNPARVASIECLARFFCVNKFSILEIYTYHVYIQFLYVYCALHVGGIQWNPNYITCNMAWLPFHLSSICMGVWCKYRNMYAYINKWLLCSEEKHILRTSLWYRDCHCGNCLEQSINSRLTTNSLYNWVAFPISYINMWKL